MKRGLKSLRRSKRYIKRVRRSKKLAKRLGNIHSWHKMF